MMFQSRRDAGKKLAEKLESYRGDERVVVAGLARGGIVVAAEIAKILDVPCTVVLVRKIGAPDNPELALGAISESGEGVFNEEVIALLGVSKEYLKKEVERERELLKKEEIFI